MLPTFTANFLNWALMSARPASASIWCAPENHLHKPGERSWRITCRAWFPETFRRTDLSSANMRWEYWALQNQLLSIALGWRVRWAYRFRRQHGTPKKPNPNSEPSGTTSPIMYGF